LLVADDEEKSVEEAELEGEVEEDEGKDVEAIF